MGEKTPSVFIPSAHGNDSRRYIIGGSRAAAVKLKLIKSRDN